MAIRDEQRSAFGRVLHRLLGGRSQSWLARALGAHPGTVSNWNTANWPDRVYLAGIARVFDLTVDQLIELVRVEDCGEAAPLAQKDTEKDAVIANGQSPTEPKRDTNRDTTSEIGSLKVGVALADLTLDEQSTVLRWRANPSLWKEIQRVVGRHIIGAYDDSDSEGIQRRRGGGRDP
jgi:hypothetical protein